MGKTLSVLFNRFGPPDHTLAFNRNPFRLSLLSRLYRDVNCDAYIEAGVRYGYTVTAMARAGASARGCEKNLKSYLIARLTTIGIRHTTIHHAPSVDFLQLALPALDRPFIYLDAHEGADPDECPILQELELLRRLPRWVAVIDDFRVDAFSPLFGKYGSLSIDLDLVGPALHAEAEIWFPAYSADHETGTPTGYCVCFRGVAAPRWLRHYYSRATRPTSGHLSSVVGDFKRRTPYINDKVASHL